MCILQQQHLLLPQHQHQHQQLHPHMQQLLVLDSSSKLHPLYHSLVSTPKASASNCWVPLPISPAPTDTGEAGPASAPSTASTQSHGAAAGQSSSSASASSSAQSSHPSSGQNSIGGGGQDDSDDDGGDKKRHAYQMAKSHSLETPDPLNAGSTTASLIQAAVNRARGTSGDPAPPAPGPAPTAFQPAPQQFVALPSSSTSAAATGPWRLSSPFAAADVSATAAEGTTSTAAPHEPPARQAYVSPFAAAQPGRQEVPAPRPQGAASSAPAATTGPHRLVSPFAAASASATAPASPAPSTTPAAVRVSPGSSATSSSSSSQRSRRSGGTPPRAPSPFAAVQQSTPSPIGSSSSSRSSGSGGSRHAAAAAAAAYAASRASKGTSSSIGSRGPAASPTPWKLHSPFAAAPLPAFSATPSQLDAVAEEEPLSMSPASAPGAAPRSDVSGAQLQPMQQAIDALGAAAAAKQRVQDGSPTPSGPSSGHSSYGVASQQRSGQRSPNPVGPGGIRSPFAAAAAVAAATHAAFTPAETPGGASPSGSPSGSLRPQNPSPISSQRGSRKGSASGSSKARPVPSMTQSISLSTLMQSGAFGSSNALSTAVPPTPTPGDSIRLQSGSTEDRSAAAAGSSGSLGTKSGSSEAGQGSGSTGSLTGMAADAALDTPVPAVLMAPVAPPARAGAGPSSIQQQAGVRPPSTHYSQHQRQLPQTAAWQSPFAAAPAAAGPAGTPAAGAAGSRAAMAGAVQVPQQAAYRPAVMPMAVSAGPAALMPPVLLALPPAQQQSAVGQAAVPMAAMYGTAAGTGAGSSLLVPQYVIPVSTGMVSAAGVMANTSTGLVSMSGGMPALLVHPGMFPAMQQARPAAQQLLSTAPTPAVFSAAAAAPSPAGNARVQVAPAAVAAGSGNTASTSAADSAASAGSAAAAPRLGCMCVAPASLAEGQPSEVQVYVLGLEGKKLQPGPHTTYRVAAFMGSRLVAETHRACRGGERLLRITVPSLPKGVLQVLVLDAANKPCFMQHLLVLPQPCTHDMNTLWSQLLRGQIVTLPASLGGAAAAAQSGEAADGSPFGSSSSSKSAQVASSSSSVTSAAPAAASDLAASDAGTAQPRRLGPQEIQALWRHSYGRVVAEVATVLLTRSRSRSAQVPGSINRSAAATAPAPGSTRSSFDAPQMQDRVSTLLHLLATHGKWAVLELLTTHVYGYGSSARAMYTDKVLWAQTAASSTSTAAAGAVAAAPAAAAASSGDAAVAGAGSSTAHVPLAAPSGADAAVLEASRQILQSWCSAIPAAQALLANLQPLPVQGAPQPDPQVTQQLLNQLMQASPASLAAAMAGAAAAMPGAAAAGSAPTVAAPAAAPEGTGEIQVEHSTQSFSFCAEAPPNILTDEDAAGHAGGAEAVGSATAEAAAGGGRLKDRSLLKGLPGKLKRAFSVKLPA